MSNKHKPATSWKSALSPKLSHNAIVENFYKLVFISKQRNESIQKLQYWVITITAKSMAKYFAIPRHVWDGDPENYWERREKPFDRLLEVNKWYAKFGIVHINTNSMETLKDRLLK